MSESATVEEDVEVEVAVRVEVEAEGGSGVKHATAVKSLLLLMLLLTPHERGVRAQSSPSSPLLLSKRKRARLQRAYGRAGYRWISQ